MAPTFYITTPIYYVNAEPHIGHAYTTIVADTLARFHRLLGYDTRFQTGTDEHGEKVVEAARAAGLSVHDFVDRVSGKFRYTWDQMQISYDHFLRTTSTEHIRVVQEILQRVHAAGDIYFSEYGGLYCYGCERFILERELVDGKCPDHQVTPTFIKEANYFFRMSKYQDWLIDYIAQHPDWIRPERYRNEVLAFLKDPMEDLCISRPQARLKWGIPLPFDDRYVTYVWFDALINYVSGLGFLDDPLYQKFWPVGQHLIAKDILKPHGIYWPTMLKAAGIDPYQHLNVHGYWQMDQGKMSKSLGNVVEPLDLIKRYGLDQVRYFFLREMVFGLDAHFSEEALIGRINADLANDLGNLFARTLAMAFKYRHGVVPQPGAAQPLDLEIENTAVQVAQDFLDLIPKLEFHKALMRLWELIGLTNRYIVASEPWLLFKQPEQQARLDTVLYHLLEVLRYVTVLLKPIMPTSAEKMSAQLGLDPAFWDRPLPELIHWGQLPIGSALQKGPALFPRLEAITAPPPTREAHPEKSKPPALKSAIDLSTFQLIDLRVGKIIAAEKIPKSEKLLKLQVDVGEIRQVVAGIGRSYRPEDLIGQTIILVANLKPARLMGIESQGMVLAAQGADGLYLLTTDPQVPPGCPVS
ncbi:MAG: methionine--tRNA ligase [Desulfobacca sp.]|nr:methionine--tRNA ligase [Desulfobacca sp.]